MPINFILLFFRLFERMYGYTCETLRGNANGPLLMARVGSILLKSSPIGFEVNFKIKFKVQTGSDRFQNFDL